MNGNHDFLKKAHSPSLYNKLFSDLFWFYYHSGFGCNNKFLYFSCYHNIIFPPFHICPIIGHFSINTRNAYKTRIDYGKNKILLKMFLIKRNIEYFIRSYPQMEGLWVIIYMLVSYTFFLNSRSCFPFYYSKSDYSNSAQPILITLNRL